MGVLILVNIFIYATLNCYYAFNGDDDIILSDDVGSHTVTVTVIILLYVRVHDPSARFLHGCIIQWPDSLT